MTEAKETPIDPDATDLDRYAVDRDGHLGHFASAGSRVVPKALLVSSEIHSALRRSIVELPRLGSGRLKLGLQGDCKFFKDMAARGLYSYDFTCRDHSYFEEGQYDLYAKPTRPLLAATLPRELRQALERVTFTTLCFARSKIVEKKSIPGL